MTKREKQYLKIIKVQADTINKLLDRVGGTYVFRQGDIPEGANVSPPYNIPTVFTNPPETAETDIKHKKGACY